MTVLELYETLSSETNLKVLSAYNGKVLCSKFNEKKHTEIGERSVIKIWAEITTRKLTYSNAAYPIVCVYANGLPEWEEAHNGD